MIEFPCPACGKRFAMPDEDAGRKFKCGCGNMNVVPGRPQRAAGVGGGPDPAVGAAAAVSDSPGVIYETRPSQMENVWVFVGLGAVVVGGAFAVPTLWGWNVWLGRLALTGCVAYLIWGALCVIRLRAIKYTVTLDNLTIEAGAFSRHVDNIDLFRVNDVDLRQTFSQRMMGIGDVVIISTDRSEPTVVLRNIPEPREAFEKIRKAAADADQKRGVVQIEQ